MILILLFFFYKMFKFVLISGRKQNILEFAKSVKCELQVKNDIYYVIPKTEKYENWKQLFPLLKFNFMCWDVDFEMSQQLLEFITSKLSSNPTSEEVVEVYTFGDLIDTFYSDIINMNLNQDLMKDIENLRENRPKISEKDDYILAYDRDHGYCYMENVPYEDHNQLKNICECDLEFLFNVKFETSNILDEKEFLKNILDDLNTKYICLPKLGQLLYGDNFVKKSNYYDNKVIAWINGAMGMVLMKKYYPHNIHGSVGAFQLEDLLDCDVNVESWTEGYDKKDDDKTLSIMDKILKEF